MGTVWDSSDQEVGKADHAGRPRIAEPDVDLDAMSTPALLAHAKSIGLDVDAAMTRLELRAAIDAA